MTATLDPYATLGVPRNATRAAAARAHRRLAKEFHPDLNPGPAAAERMRRINQAWRILSDPERRSRYDAARTSASWSRPGSVVYGPRHAATWTEWPQTRRTAAGPRMRRPTRRDQAEPSFGDQPAVFVAVLGFLTLLMFVGTWLGSLSR